MPITQLATYLQVRVGVNYCSLNLYDVKCMENPNDEYILPMIPGTELSGEVIELGPDCKQNLEKGEKVAVLLCMIALKFFFSFSKTSN